MPILNFIVANLFLISFYKILISYFSWIIKNEFIDLPINLKNVNNEYINNT